MQSFRVACFVLIFSCGTLYGQSREGKDSVFSFLPRHIIKFSPLHLLNFYPSVQVAYELHVKDNFSLQVDAGYVFPYDNYDPAFQNKQGAKLKTELRYYTPYLLRKRGAHYFSLEPYINFVNFDRETSQTECFDQDCTILYTRRYNYQVKYRERGIAFKYGIHRFARRITFDMNMGVMLRHVDYKKPGIPQGFDEPDFQEWFTIPNEEKRTVLGPAAGFRLGYKLK